MELERRQQIEREYHNRKYKDNYSPESSGTVNSAYTYFQSLINQLPPGRVLDFGCGDGWVSIMLAKKGYDVYGIDISIELIKKARSIAKETNLSLNVRFEEMAGEDLKFQDNYFDAVFGSAVLHHTDFKLALDNIHRVLKPGGIGLFIEPLNQNILLKIWRILTPWRRSPTERALTLREINMIMNKFPPSRLHYFIFSSMLTKGLITIFPNINCFNKINTWFESIDDHLISRYPKLGKSCAVVVIELVKDEAI